MIEPHDFNVRIASAGMASKLLAAYEILAHWNPEQPPEIIYVNVTALTDVFTLTQANGNTRFVELMRHNPVLTVRIFAISDNNVEVDRLAFARVRDLSPQCNVHGFNVAGTGGRPLICSNGQTYTNQSEAAKALGLSQGAISRHLRGHLAHVKNYRFQYAIASDVAGAAR